MKIRVLSDLHLEFEDFCIVYQGEDILILAGDICPDFKRASNLIKQYINTYNIPVILILGNHDFWYNSFDIVRELWKKEKINNFYLLDNNIVKIGDILFVGTTLWTDATNDELDIVSWYVADFDHIYDMNSEKWIEENVKAIKFLKQTVRDNKNEKIVVITHHLPSYKSIAPKYEGNKYNAGFANNGLDRFILSSNIHTWIHGHTHINRDYMLGGTRIICNPRGYISKNRIENPEFNPNLIIEI